MVVIFFSSIALVISLVGIFYIILSAYRWYVILNPEEFAYLPNPGILSDIARKTVEYYELKDQWSAYLSRGKDNPQITNSSEENQEPAIVITENESPVKEENKEARAYFKKEIYDKIILCNNRNKENNDTRSGDIMKMKHSLFKLVILSMLGYLMMSIVKGDLL